MSASRFATDLIEILPKLRRLALALSGNANDADDLVQAACERAIRAKDQCRPGARLDLWVFAIMRNLWIDAMRRRRRESLVDLGGAAIDVPGMDGREVSEAKLLLADVGALIRTLPEEQRTVLVLVCQEGLSYDEVARRTGVPIGTVMSRLARARRRLDRLLHSDATAVSDSED